MHYPNDRLTFAGIRNSGKQLTAFVKMYVGVDFVLQ